MDAETSVSNVQAKPQTPTTPTNIRSHLIFGIALIAAGIGEAIGAYTIKTRKLSFPT